MKTQVVIIFLMIKKIFSLKRFFGEQIFEFFLSQEEG